MVGVARPYAVGLLLCTGAGLLSALNVGYSLSQGIIATAAKAGESAFAGSNLIWWLVLARGAVTKWKFALPIARRWIMISLSVVLGAIGIPGWSGTQG